MATTCLLLVFLCGHLWLSDGQKLSFLVVGDFGGMPIWPYTTPTQLKVAGAMGEVAKKRGVRFVLGLGDNFYYNGVKQANDARFRDTFENVYKEETLERATWYMTAGNHDHEGNVSAQIAYSRVSRRWYFPDFYYTAVERIPGTSMTVQVVAVDTTLLCFYGKRHRMLGYPRPRGQQKWIENTLKHSIADYLIVIGHHPIQSAGLHGGTKCLEKKLKPLLEEHRVTAYLCGHDHVQQHIQENDSAVHQFVVGSGNFYSPARLHDYLLPRHSVKYFYGNSGGFMLVEASPDELRTTQMNEHNQVLHAVSIKPRQKPDSNAAPKDDADLLDEFFSLSESND